MPTHSFFSRVLRLAVAAGFSILIPGVPAALAASSILFPGNGAPGLDQIRIAIDDPSNSTPGPPADVGATDFTLEFWMNAAAADNSAGPITCGANTDWVHGNVVVDRDRTGDRKFGVS